MFTPIDRQVIGSWYRYLLEPRIAKLTGRTLRATGPRIAIVGNCQSFNMAYAIQLLCPAALVDHFPLIPRSHVPLRIFARTLATYDFVFSHDFPAGFIPSGGFKELRDLLNKTTLLPQINFAAFHPDSVYVGDSAEGHAPIFGPLGPYRSALAVFAFRKGLSLQEANALFNHNVFESLGYYGFWNDASAELIQSCKRDCDMDLSAELIKWARRVAFMHTVNHPKPFVLVDVAKKLLAKIGLLVPDLDYENYMIDDFLRYPTFPIYPPIGAYYGCAGSYTFKLAPAAAARDVGDYLVLPEFLIGSYAKFRRFGDARLANPRVDAWLGERATADMIVSLARENLRMGRLPVR